MREAPKICGLPEKPERHKPIAEKATDSNRIGRRPNLSASGAKAIEPTTMPTNPALISTPNSVLLNAKSFEILVAVKAMANTSKPSKKFIMAAIATIAHWYMLIGL